MIRTPETEVVVDQDLAKAFASSPIMASSHDAFLVSLDDLIKAYAIRRTERLRVLDIACGAGTLTLRIAKELPMAEVVGVDSSSEMLMLARRNLPGQRNLRVRYIRADVASLAPLKWRFDLLTCNGALHHFRTPKLLWKTVPQIANPKALLLVQDLSRPHTVGDLKQVMRRKRAEVGTADPLLGEMESSLMAAYTASEVQEQLSQARLRHLRVDKLENSRIRVSGSVSCD